MKNYKIAYQHKIQHVIKNKCDEFKFSSNEILGIKGSLLLFLIIGFLIGLLF